MAQNQADSFPGQGCVLTRAFPTVSALRPMRVVLVTDDPHYADTFLAAAERRGIPVILAATDEDIDGVVARGGQNVAVFDGGDSLARTARTAAAFAVVNPDVAVGVVADRAETRRAGNLVVIDRWRSVERLLGELQRVFVAIEPKELRRSSTGD
jgi:hypothetical protein